MTGIGALPYDELRMVAKKMVAIVQEYFKLKGWKKEVDGIMALQGGYFVDAHSHCGELCINFVHSEEGNHWGLQLHRFGLWPRVLGEDVGLYAPSKEWILAYLEAFVRTMESGLLDSAIKHDAFCRHLESEQKRLWDEYMKGRKLSTPVPNDLFTKQPAILALVELPPSTVTFENYKIEVKKIIADCANGNIRPLEIRD